MKNRFVKITLVLTMLLVMAVPAQAFAAEKNCSLNQTKTLNTQISKIYSQIPQTTINKFMQNLSQCSKSKVDVTQLQNILKQCNGGKITVTAPSDEDTTGNTGTEPGNTTTKPDDTATNPGNTTTTPADPKGNDTTSNTDSNTGNSAALGTYEQQVVDLVNQERAAAGLSALKVNTKLSAVAEKKAEDMAVNNYFSHTSPTYGSPFDMMKQFGISYTSAGENIAMGQKTPADVMNGWMNSSGHRANILNTSYTEIGVGYVTNSNGTGYWVQEFIRP